MGQKGEAIRKRIIDAADQLFYRQGFENTSFSDIASSVKISRGNFYYHFKSKDEILNAVIDARMDEIRAMLVEWETRYPDARQRIHQYIDILTNNQDSIQQHGCPVGSLCMELSKINHAMHDNAQQMFALFRDWLVAQFTLLGHGENAETMAMHLLSRGQGIATVASTFSDTEFLQQEVKALKDWVDVQLQNAS